MFYGHGRIGEEQGEGNFQDMFEANLYGPYMLARYLLPLLLSTPNGKKQVTTVTSVMTQTTWPGYCGYQTSKFAILRFSELLDEEYRSEGITAVSLNLGSFRTTLSSHLPQSVIDGSEFS